MKEPRSVTRSLSERKIPSMVVAEIGVRDGLNALQMLSALDIKVLHLIDNYSPYQDGTRVRTVDEQYGHYRVMFNNILPHIERTHLVHQPSVAAASLYPDEYFDLVYIDGDHSYDSVRNDLMAWWPKVRMGGFLSGHDYTPDWPGVIIAVDEFTQDKGRPDIFDDADWMLQKI